MQKQNRKDHWENIYQTKELTEVSWYQPTPTTSLDYFTKFNVPKTAKIIDIAGGDSFLVDHLLELGYYDITVCNSAKERCPVIPGNHKSIHQWFADPSKVKGTDEEIAAAFASVRDEIEAYVKEVVEELRSIDC